MNFVFVCLMSSLIDSADKLQEALSYWENRLLFHQKMINLKEITTFVSNLIQNVKGIEGEVEALETYGNIFAQIVDGKEILRYEDKRDPK